MKPAIWDPVAIKEYNKGLAASRSPVKFQKVVDDAMATILNNPQVAPLVGRTQARQYILKERIPYSIVYVDEPATLTVYAFAHHKRRPRYWQRRLRKR